MTAISTAAVLAFFAYGDQSDAKKNVESELANFLQPFRNVADAEFSALCDLRENFIDLRMSGDVAVWVVKAIDTRLAEATAAMAGAGSPTLASSLTPPI